LAQLLSRLCCMLAPVAPARARAAASA